MDGRDFTIGWIHLRDARVQLFRSGRSEKFDRMGLSGVEPEGGSLRELRWGGRKSCSSATAIDRLGLAVGTSAYRGSPPIEHCGGTSPWEGCRRGPEGFFPAGKGDVGRSPLVDKSALDS